MALVLNLSYIQRAIQDGALPSWTTLELRELLEWIDARREELDSIELAVRWELDMDGTEEIKAQLNLDAAASCYTD